jgi:hypothetical protein
MMNGINDKAFAALGAYPIVQSAVAILILVAGLYFVSRALKDKSAPLPLPPRDPVPQWLMMGPLHDMMGAVHDVAEQSRRTNDLLERVDQSLMACKVTLELIRDESRLR